MFDDRMYLLECQIISQVKHRIADRSQPEFGTKPVGLLENRTDKRILRSKLPCQYLRYEMHFPPRLRDWETRVEKAWTYLKNGRLCCLFTAGKPRVQKVWCYIYETDEVVETVYTLLFTKINDEHHLFMSYYYDCIIACKRLKCR